MRVFIILLFLLLNLSLFSQPKIDSLKTELKHCETDSCKAFLYTKLCYDYLYVDIRISRQHAYNALEHARHTSRNDWISTAYLNIGITYQYTGDLDTAISYLDTAFVHAAVSTKKSLEATIQNSLGAIHILQGKTETGIKYFERSIGILQAENDSVQLARCYNNLGITYNEIGNSKKALEYFQLALTLKEKTDTKNVGTILLNIGKIFINMREHQKAKEYLQQALSYYFINRNKRFGMICYNNIGVATIHLGITDSAFFYYNKALELSTEIDDKVERASIYTNLGYIHRLRGEFSKALSYYHKSLAFSEYSGNVTSRINTLLNISSVYHEQGIKDSAIAYAFKAEKISDTLWFTESLIKTYSVMYKMFANFNDWKNSYHYLLKLKELEDSVYSEKRNAEVRELEKKYETEKKQKFIEQQKAELAIKQSEIRKERFKRNIIIILAIASIVALLLLFWIYAQAKKTRIFKTIIETEEKERKRFAEDLHDEVGPFLYGIKLYINRLNSNITSQQKKELTEYLMQMIDETIVNIKLISNNFIPNILTDFGFEKAVSSFINKILRTNTIAIEFNADNLPQRFNSTCEIVLYRVIIELINNTLKHANASKITIKTEKKHNTLLVIYTDNGKGFDLNEKLIQNKGFGLNNVINRIKTMNGKYKFRSEANQGIRFLFEIQYKK